MDRKSGIRSLMTAVLVAVWCTSALAWTVDEVEPNYGFDVPQKLTLGPDGTVTVNAFLGNADFDVYSIDLPQGAILTVDIDGGSKTTFDGSIDTHITLLGPGPSGPLTYMFDVDDSGLASPDPGSIDLLDSYYENFVVATGGEYFIAVTAFNYSFGSGGVLNGAGGNSTGSYSLVLSAVLPAGTTTGSTSTDTGGSTTTDAGTGTPSQDPAPTSTTSTTGTTTPDVQLVAIDIKPGPKQYVRINPTSRSSIPVAILSVAGFDAVTMVDVDSLTFGHNGDEKSLKRCIKHGIDVNRDGLPDLVCHFANNLANFQLSDETGYLMGKKMDGTPISGSGVLKVIPYKRRGWTPDQSRSGGHRASHEHEGRGHDRDDHEGYTPYTGRRARH